jgi:hypothetical protein
VNSPRQDGTQTAQVVLLPLGKQFGTLFFFKWVPTVLEGATREKFFRHDTIHTETEGFLISVQLKLRAES